MPFGSTGWGSSAWGDGDDDGAFYVVSARAIASNAVRVRFSVPPAAASPIVATDALRLTNWQIVNEDTGLPLILLASRPAAGDPLSIELVVLGTFASSLITYEVSVDGILSSVRDPLVDPKSAEFQGMPATKAAPPRRELLDVMNLQTDRTRFNGSLAHGASGDYLKESGAQLFRKLLYRRWITAVNEFLHLAGQNYGMGLQPKEHYRSIDLVALESEFARQALREPETGQFQGTVTLLADGRLTARGRVKLKSGEDVPFDFANGQGGLSF